MKKDLVPSKLSNLYASIIDQRRFTSLSSIMWEEFSMLGEFEIIGLENFILAMKQLENYQSTMHQVMNVQGEWDENIYKGETYCIASHIFNQDNKPYKLDMGIIYSDVIEVREEAAKFTSRTFSLKWKKTDTLDLPEQN